jgi:hypothetical protein
MNKTLFFISISLCLNISFAFAQGKVITGIIRDQHSDERVPYASVEFQKSHIGRSADSAGRFSFVFDNWFRDTLIITDIGYEDLKIPIEPLNAKGDTLYLPVYLVGAKIKIDVVVKTKINRGLLMWKRIVKHKPENDRYRFNNFSYELYNKLELDINNVNKEKLGSIKLLKPFNFILENVDTTEGRPFLPAYITETISNYYYQKSPEKRREVFKAAKTIGVNNESVTKLLGGMDQNVNFYDNFIPVFNKQFVSPISDHGDNYYNYKVADTQYAGGRRLIHFFFSPKRKGENTFTGDCWVHDTTFAIQKMNLRLGSDANVNYVHQLSLIQEYKLINDSTWFLSKDKFVVDITPFGKSKLSFIGRKTTTYRDVVVNDTSVTNELTKNKIKEQVVLPNDASEKTDQYWAEARHEPLSKNEQSIYHMIDTLLKMPKFRHYTNAINFIGTGYLDVGNFIIGPWQNWIYENVQEGWRVRFDFGTNHKFSQNLVLHGYAAYGFGDHQWKGEGDIMYFFKKHPRTYIYGEYDNDYDYGQDYFDEISSDNIFALAIRKNNVPIKYIRLKREDFELFKEWDPGFSVVLGAQNREYTPVRNLPDKSYFNNGRQLSAFEASVKLRFAYLEKFLENTFYRTSLGSPLPIIEFKYTQSISGVLNSQYNYSKLFARVSDSRTIAPYGSISYNVFAEKTYGTLPYMFLNVAPGNEIYYYNPYAFNMMNRYEYIHDRDFGINFEHNFGNGLFRFIPFTRKMKFRQFWTAKALWGGLSPENKALNFVGSYPFKTLDGKTYLELGTGIDNILKVLRFDFIWRVLPKQTSNSDSNFGVFGSFHLNF